MFAGVRNDSVISLSLVGKKFLMKIRGICIPLFAIHSSSHTPMQALRNLYTWILNSYYVRRGKLLIVWACRRPELHPLSGKTHLKMAGGSSLPLSLHHTSLERGRSVMQIHRLIILSHTVFRERILFWI